MLERVLIAAIAFVDDKDLVIDGNEAESKMQRMLKIYDDLYKAKGGHIEEDKSKFFAWQWRWRQGNKVITDKKVTLEVNEKKVKSISSKRSERTLGVYMSPSLKWEIQFEKMKEKMIEAIFKLKNTEIVAPIVYMCYNAYLIKKVYFRYGVLSLTPQ